MKTQLNKLKKNNIFITPFGACNIVLYFDNSLVYTLRTLRTVNNKKIDIWTYNVSWVTQNCIIL